MDTVMVEQLLRTVVGQPLTTVGKYAYQDSGSSSTTAALPGADCKLVLAYY